MVSRVKQSIWIGFRSMEQDLESSGLRLKFWLWKCEREDNEMSRCYRRINTYLTTQGIHKEIRSYILATQGNPPKRLREQEINFTTQGIHQGIRSNELVTQERTLKKEKYEKYY